MIVVDGDARDRRRVELERLAALAENLEARAATGDRSALEELLLLNQRRVRLTELFAVDLADDIRTSALASRAETATTEQNEQIQPFCTTIWTDKGSHRCIRREHESGAHRCLCGTVET